MPRNRRYRVILVRTVQEKYYVDVQAPNANAAWDQADALTEDNIDALRLMSEEIVSFTHEATIPFKGTT
jgi:hypothetical protein